MFVNVFYPIRDKKAHPLGEGRRYCSWAKIVTDFGLLGVNRIKKFSETQAKKTLQNCFTSVQGNTKQAKTQTTAIP